MFTNKGHFSFVITTHCRYICSGSTVESGTRGKNVHCTGTYLPHTVQCRSVDITVNHCKGAFIYDVRFLGR